MLSKEDLLKILQQARDNSEDKPKKGRQGHIKDTPHIDVFISDMKITKSETNRVTNNILYHFYINKWQGVKPAEKVNRIKFFRHIGRLFKKGRSGSRRFFYLNLEGITRVDRYKGKLLKDEINERLRKKRVEKQKNKGKSKN
jgi:hypothetical protein